MEKLTEQLRQQISASAPQTPEGAVATTISLWDALAKTLVPIIGDDSFRSLLERSLHLNGKNFPWLVLDMRTWDHSDRFSGLRDNLNSRDPVEAADAGLALLTTFVETLVELIDVPLVSNILRSAWGDHIIQR
jgi:hypothetical protein